MDPTKDSIPASPSALRRAHASMLMLWVALVSLCRVWARAVAKPTAANLAAFKAEQAAVAGLPNFVGIIMLIVGSIMGATVGMIVLAQLTPVYFGNFTAFLVALTGTSTGNGIADAIIAIIVIVVAIVGPLAFLGLAIFAVSMKFRGGRGTS